MNKHSMDTEGYKHKQDDIRDIVIEPSLETVKNMYVDRDYIVELMTDEFSSVCPKTGLPDFATLHISYIPDKLLVEEKSLKLYLTAYRNIGIFQEHATNKILDDFVEKIKPRRVKILARWKARGGITVDVETEWKSDS